MVEFDYKRFKRDSYNLEKDSLIRIYIGMIEAPEDDEVLGLLNLSQRLTIMKIINEILFDKYDCEILEVTRGVSDGIH